MRRLVSLAAVSALGISTLIGCSHQQPVTMAPPMNQNSGYSNAQPPVGNMAPQGNMAGNMNPAGGNVFQWQDVPANQQVPIARATFDQGGYQIIAQSGETIVVPFVNNNLYAMKFGRSNNGNYFINENGVPTLYLQPGQGLENAAAQGAMWYPIPQNYAYTQPMYVAVAPSWNDYTNMGWYPGMTYYGGMSGYTPYGHFGWMPGFYISIGGHRYSDYGGYHTYYNANPGYIRNRVVYNTYNTPRGGSGRTFGSSTGSFGSGRFGGSTGSSGTRRTTGSSTFGSSAAGSGGSFGTRRTGSGFGGSTPSTGSGFGNRVPSLSGRNTGSSFGGGSSNPRTTGSSFGGGSTGSTSTPRSTGSSFGGSTRTSGSSFGGGSGRSFGGGSRRR
ncbi:MAG: hypothetical protein JWN14_4864 [Chthonomonadales bacterium]|nr:hypothetical protein [Chthonomonadales bacterium]